MSKAYTPQSLLILACVILGDAIFFHCNLLHMSTRNDSPHRRWAFANAYNMARNSSVVEHHHPQYTQLHQVSVHPCTPNRTRYQYIPVHLTAQSTIHPSTPNCTRYQYTSQSTQPHRVSVHSSTPNCTRYQHIPVHPTAQGISVHHSTPNCIKYQYIPAHPTAQGTNTSQYTQLHKV